MRFVLVLMRTAGFEPQDMSLPFSKMAQHPEKPFSFCISTHLMRLAFAVTGSCNPVCLYVCFGSVTLLVPVVVLVVG